MSLDAGNGDGDPHGDLAAEAGENTMRGLWHVLSSRRPLHLRFALYPSRRPSGALCPCLEVNLPALGQLSSGCTTTDRSNPAFRVTRILDPEHKTPYVSLSPIFLAAGLSTVQGLLLLSLNPSSDYSLSLAGLEPWDDIWVSFRLATHVAKELGVYPRLSALLDPRTKLAWSLDEGDRGISHNWRVPAEFLDPATYSADTLLAAAGFAGIKILRDGEQLTTLVSVQQRKQAKSVRAEEVSDCGKLHEKLVRWSHMCYAAWYDVRHARARLLDSQHDAGLNDGRTKNADLELARGVAQDIDILHVPPTLQDVQEWLQHSMPLDLGLKAAKPVQELTTLTRTQYMRLRQLDTELGTRGVDQRLHVAAMDETGCLDVLDDLELQLRAKMGSLHRLQLLSQQNGLPHLRDTTESPIEALGDMQTFTWQDDANPYQHLLDSIKQIIQRSIRDRLDTRASSSDNKDIHARIESLHERLEDLYRCLDQLQVQSTLQCMKVESIGTDQHKSPMVTSNTRSLRKGCSIAETRDTSDGEDDFLSKMAPSRTAHNSVLWDHGRSTYSGAFLFLPYVFIAYLVFRLARSPSEPLSERELCFRECRSILHSNLE